MTSKRWPAAALSLTCGALGLIACSVPEVRFTGAPGGPDACVGLECRVTDCASRGMPPTSVSGTVFAPNGTLPLYNVNVYVPRDPVGDFAPGVSCDRCSDGLPGSPVVRTTSDQAGQFRLDNVPVGDGVTLIVTTGKWRKRIALPRLAACTDLALSAAETSLPSSQLEGDIPQIAVTTGSADSLECLVRKLGIADSEITIATKPGRVHLYKGNGVGAFAAGFAGGGGDTFTPAPAMWSSLDALEAYDIVVLSCEGAQNAATKPQAALDAVKQYADLGGRVLLSHWHNIWLEGDIQSGSGAAPAVWPAIATWSNAGNLVDPAIDTIDEASPRGAAFATWMLATGGSTTRGQIPLVVGTGRATCTAVDANKAERWVFNTIMNATQTFQFSTPNEQPGEKRCGKVGFTDMHVSTSAGTGAYPLGCAGGSTLSPQEKAIAFLLFDLSSCVRAEP